MTTAFVEGRSRTSTGVERSASERGRGSQGRVATGTFKDLAKRATVLARQNEATRAREVDLGLLLARMEGVDRADVASMIGTSTKRLAAYAHHLQPIPANQGDRIAELLRILCDLHLVIDRRATSRWLHLEVPALGGHTPIGELQRGREGLERVARLVKSYLDPSYS